MNTAAPMAAGAESAVGIELAGPEKFKSKASDSHRS